ncbi:LOW QUALITY PROTEIN: hypothetical protein PHMEG_00017214 [Phytophthora megakarya]|uniref:Uncharacterized protein n=1 Tax=Phytophthora megakarya TaxID=4795 RepID=A0A225VXD0_9STRA|nr:LOW QUALITY PROTEIN: hypothetical protein PHMEG_00017214 [Phytophthora megakarya]
MDFMHAGFDFVFEKDLSNFRMMRPSIWQERDPFGKPTAWTYLCVRTKRYISDPENTLLSKYTIGRQPSTRSGMGRTRGPMGDPACLRWQGMASCSESG